jgi:hypothetical protein
VISFDANVLPADVNVTGLSWDPATNELTLSESDGTTHVVSLATLAADKFLQGSSYDPATHELTLTMTDGSTYVVPLGDLVPVVTSSGIQGDGTSGDAIRPDFDQLPLASEGVIDAANDYFVVSAAEHPDGARYPLQNAVDLIWSYAQPEGYLNVATGVGISGNGQDQPLAFAADALPHHFEDTGDPEVYLVASAPYRPAGIRLSTTELANELWVYFHETQVANKLVEALTVDVQDAFGNHLFYALP